MFSETQAGFEWCCIVNLHFISNLHYLYFTAIGSKFLFKLFIHLKMRIIGECKHSMAYILRSDICQTEIRLRFCLTEQ